MKTEPSLDTPAKVLAAALPARAIIGESELAGLPISAPVLIGQDAPLQTIRWRQRADYTFSLECLCADGTWQEVPLWYEYDK